MRMAQLIQLQNAMASMLFNGLCEPFEGAFDSYDSLGTFSPSHAHAAVKENRARIYQDMYEYTNSVVRKIEIWSVGK